VKYCDGTGRSKRVDQIDFFNHFDKTYRSYQYMLLNAAPGLGKSFIARALNRHFKSSVIITFSNQQVDQYCETYPELVPIKGIEHYETEKEYDLAKRRVRDGAPAIFNPISYYYYYINTPDLRPNFVIIDEAHNLASLLVSVIAQPFHCGYWGIPSGLGDVAFLSWLDERIIKLEKGRHISTKFEKSYQRLNLLKQYLDKNIDKVKFSYEMRPNSRTRAKEQYFCVTPLTFPKDLLNIVFGEDTKILFMSGTFNQLHAKELGIDNFDYKVYDHPAPRENRTIEWLPVKDRQSWGEIAFNIRQIYEQNIGLNTLVHLPYNQQVNPHINRFLGTFNPITHTKETKQHAIDKFKRQGGILLASGMAEGIDLPGDQCRLIIIPKLLFPNLGDDGVKKRKLFPDGNSWYNNQTITTTIQQIYRGVRGKNDHCRIIVLDPLFRRLVKQTEKYLSPDFVKSIKWS